MKMGKTLEGLKAKWQIFSREQQLPAWEIDQLAELEIASEQLDKEARAIADLKQTAGWKLLEGYWLMQIEVLRTRLEKGDDADLRAELKVLRKQLRFIENLVAAPM